MERIVEIIENDKTYYQPQHKFMFWWEPYTEICGDYFITNEFSTIESALSFIERQKKVEKKKEIKPKVVWQSNKH